jgi:hypothetical protein
MMRLLFILFSLCLAMPALAVDRTLTVTATNGTVQEVDSSTGYLKTLVGTYADGTIVQIVARPNVGYYFAGWSGALAGEVRQIAHIYMDGNKAVTARFVTWVPPIGCPAKPFGVTESYRGYDAGGVYVQNPSLTYSASDSGGLYTHYVDKSGTYGTAQDSTSPASPHYCGTKIHPRLTIPPLASLLPGSIVEIHGGPYTGNVLRSMYIVASAAQPAFVRGIGYPILQTSPQIRLGGSYVILEGMDIRSSLQNCGVSTYSGDTFRDHLVVRDCLFQGQSNILMGYSYSATKPQPFAEDLVMYNNILWNPGIHYSETDTGSCMFSVQHYARRVWVIDNICHGAYQDAFQSGSFEAAPLATTGIIYVARNELCLDRENAVDFKVANGMIVSQNRIYGYRTTVSSNGDVIRVNDESEQANIYLMDNWIWDGDNGISPYHSSSAAQIVGNVIYNMSSHGVFDASDRTYQSDVIGNTIIGCPIGTIQSNHTYDNIFNLCATPTSGVTDAHDNLISVPLRNAPTSVDRLDYWHYTNENATLTHSGGVTLITVAGADFSALGISTNDRIVLEYVPEIQYNATTNPTGCVTGTASSNSRANNNWLLAGAVGTDTIALGRDILAPATESVSGVSINIYYYPEKAETEVTMNAGHGITAGQKIEYNHDSILRTVSAVDAAYYTDPAGTAKDRLVIAPGIVGAIHGDEALVNWGSASSAILDPNIVPGGVAEDTGVVWGPVAVFTATFGLDIAVDIQGGHRYHGAAYDVGAFEVGSTPPATDPPSAATLVSPADTATGVSITPTLSWTAGALAVSHICYCDTANSPTHVAYSGAGLSVAPGTLAYSTTYYWRVDEWNPYGTTAGTQRSFTTTAAPATKVFLFLR